MMHRQAGYPSGSFLTRLVMKAFAFVRFAEFEILFVLFVLLVYLLLKDITLRPEYNQILVKKPRDGEYPF